MKRAWCSVLTLVLFACQTNDAQQSPGDENSTDTITRTSETGPIRATVTVNPAKPTLGDSLVLVLEVTAEPGVEVHMPPFGDALGRFTITESTRRARTEKDGASVAVRRYVLDTPMSGRLTIPSLLIEFADRRPGRSSDGGLALQELLTEELSLEVASILTDGQSLAELRPARGPLPERRRGRDWWLIGCLVLLALAVAGGLGYVLWRRGAVVRIQASAFDVAIGRLRTLEAGGLPDADRADQWYVDLSDIIRHYLENRFALRAPELTTEEFLRVAGQFDALHAEHRTLLHTFLEQCDRVKFASYKPQSSESQHALVVARQFLDDTRLDASSVGSVETRRAA